MFGIGFVEIIVILGIALIVIGPQNLPDMAKSLGKGYVEFMRAFRDMKQSIEEDADEIKKTLDPTDVIFESGDYDSSKDKSKDKGSGDDYSRSEKDNKGE